MYDACSRVVNYRVIFNTTKEKGIAFEITHLGYVDLFTNHFYLIKIYGII